LPKSRERNRLDEHMTRTGKGVLGSVLVMLALIAGGAYWLFGNLDSIVQRAIARYGSQMTQAKVTVDAVNIRTADGLGVVRGLMVGNPAGFKSEHAVKVGVIEVAVDIRTLADPVVVVKRIVIESPDVVYEKSATGTNFEAIQHHIAQSLASGNAGGPEAPIKPARKIIVDELVIRNAHAQATAPALLGQSISATLPDVVLRNVGREEGGLTPAQLGDRVAKAISQRLVASMGFDRALRSIGDRVKGVFGR
jgi:hypothetical protein